MVVPRPTEFRCAPSGPIPAGPTRNGRKPSGTARGPTAGTGSSLFRRRGTRRRDTRLRPRAIRIHTTVRRRCGRARTRVPSTRPDGVSPPPCRVVPAPVALVVPGRGQVRMAPDLVIPAGPVGLARAGHGLARVEHGLARV